MEQRGEEYIEVDLLQILRAIYHHALAIALATILCGAMGFSLAYWVIPPKYQASALLYVNNSSFSVGSTSISLSDLSASQTLVNTYIAILDTRLTLEEVIERAELDYTYEELEKMVEAEAVNRTEIFEVTVTSKDPAEAELIANTIVAVLPAKITQVVDGSSVRTVDYAVVPEERYSPDVLIWTLVGILAGGLLGVGGVIVREMMDEQIRSEDELLQNYDLPVLAAIPDMLAKRSSKGYGSYYIAEERKKS